MKAILLFTTISQLRLKTDVRYIKLAGRWPPVTTAAFPNEMHVKRNLRLMLYNHLKDNL